MATRTYHKRGALIDGYEARSHPNYPVWSGMKTRCTNPKAANYDKYGGRGVTYCSDWEHFANFCRDMGVRPSPSHTLDRINNEGNYEPGNCRWATPTQQCLNRGQFANNSTGFTGVVPVRGRFVARYDEGGTRYQCAGTYATPEEAAKARAELIAAIARGRPIDHLLERKPRFDSSTGVRGIARHQKGGFLVRCTRNGVREYVGFYTTLEAAVAARDEWLASKKSSKNSPN